MVLLLSEENPTAALFMPVVRLKGRLPFCRVASCITTIRWRNYSLRALQNQPTSERK
jgi:hypothetical protein